MPTAGTADLTVTAVTIYDEACTEFTVWNDDATDDAMVNVVGLHDAGEFFSIGPGLSQAFIIEDMGITDITAKASAGTVPIRYGVTAETRRS